MGLERRGFSAGDVRVLRECYRLLYRSNLNVKQACGQIASEIATAEVRDHLLDFIEKSQRGIVHDSRPGLGRLQGCLKISGVPVSFAPFRAEPAHVIHNVVSDFEDMSSGDRRRAFCPEPRPPRVLQRHRVWPFEALSARFR